MRKDGNNKHVDKEADGKSNRGLDCIIKICLSNSPPIISVDFAALKALQSSFPQIMRTLTRAE
jgi:hypothetical protein